jgi:hypothetical protein
VGADRSSQTDGDGWLFPSARGQTTVRDSELATMPVSHEHR